MPRTVFAAAANLLAIALLTAAAPAQMAGEAVSLKVIQPVNVYEPGKGYVLTVRLSISPGLHINSDIPEDPTYVPTMLSMASTPGVTFGQPTFPPPVLLQLPFMERPEGMFEGVVDVRVPVTISPKATPGVRKVSLLLSYQACDGSMCFLPQRLPATFSLKVAP